MLEDLQIAPRRERAPGWTLLAAIGVPWIACAVFAIDRATAGSAFAAGAALACFVAPFAVVRAIAPRQRTDGELLEQLLVQAVEQTTQTVVLTDPSGTILWVNPAFEKLTGYARAEVLGKNPRLLKSNLHDPAWYAELWRVLRSGEVFRGRFVNLRKDGSTYELEQTIAPVRDASGELRCFLAVGDDMTAESMLRAQLIQAQKMEIVGRLAGGVAHDFNNLIAVISSYAGFLREEAPASSQMREDAEEVERAARRAAVLARRLLTLSRKESAAPEAIDLAHVVTELARTTGRMLGSGIRIEVSAEEGVWPVLVDRVQLEQVLMNLAVNALDAMDGGGTLRIAVANRTVNRFQARRFDIAAGDWVEVTVSDDGAGMPPEVLARAFDPFFTTKSRDKGTGLGLATVREIVHAAGGEVQLESTPGVGTTVRLLLPPTTS